MFIFLKQLGWLLIWAPQFWKCHSGIRIYQINVDKIRWSQKHGRPLCGDEMLGVMGLPVTQSLADAASSKRVDVSMLSESAKETCMEFISILPFWIPLFAQTGQWLYKLANIFTKLQRLPWLATAWMCHQLDSSCSQSCWRILSASFALASLLKLPGIDLLGEENHRWGEIEHFLTNLF